MTLQPTVHCSFCRQLALIYRRDLPPSEQDAAVEELFDRADRMQRAHRLYQKRRGMRRFR